MTGTSVIIAILIWFALVAIRTVYITSGHLSLFERQRRVKEGDQNALKQQQHDELLPDVRALKYLVETLLPVTLVAVLVKEFGLIYGVIFSFILLLLVPFGERLPGIERRANKWYQRREARIVKFTKKWRGILKALRERGVMDAPRVHSKQELVYLAKTAPEVFNNEELLLLQNAVTFTEKTVADVMTPRSVVEAVGASETFGPLLLDRLHKTGHSRFPVVEGDLSRVVGMLYLRDLIPPKVEHKTVRDAMRPKVYYVNQHKTLDHVLHAFLRTKHHLFIVVNELEETTGVISIEDIIETIIGRKLRDEFDQYEDLRAVARLAAAKRKKSNHGEHV